MKRANGTGTITKLTGNRRKPYAVKITLGYTEEGKLQYKYLSYHRTRREAEKALSLYTQDPYTLSQYTFKQLYDEFYALQEKTKAASTMSNHRNALNHLKPLWNIKAQNIDRIMLQRFYTNLDATPSIVNNIRRTLKGVISYAVKLGVMPVSMIEVHKALDLTASKENNEHIHKLVPEETRQWLWENRSDDTARLILVYLYTGCRYVELYNLKTDDIYEDHFDIRQAKTAAGIRTVPIANNIRDLFPLPTVPKYSTFLRKFKELLPEYMPHDTRHTFITMLTEAKVDLRVIQSIVGHSRGSTVTERYTHITLEAKLEAVNLIV